MLKALLLKKKRSPLKSRANVFFKTDAVPTRNDMLKFQQMMSPMDGYSKFINECGQLLFNYFFKYHFLI